MIPVVLMRRRVPGIAVNKVVFAAAAAICIIASITTIAFVVNPSGNSGESTSLIFKTAALYITFIVMFASAKWYNERELLWAFAIFAIFEGVVFTFFAFTRSLDVNQNTIALRIASSGLVLYGVLWGGIKYFPILGTSSAVAIVGSRTALLATICSLTITTIETRSRGNRFGYFIVFTLLFAVLFANLSSITKSIQDLAIKNLNSSNPVAGFFLSDKSKQKIKNDFFDRRKAWNYAVGAISKRPLLGVGVGGEHSALGFRSHNAYLSIAVEGGLPYLFFWIVLYSTFVRRLIISSPRAIWFSSPVFRVVMACFSYMLFAGMAESSGVGSVGTPINQVFLFGWIWISSRRWYFAPPTD